MYRLKFRHTMHASRITASIVSLQYNHLQRHDCSIIATHHTNKKLKSTVLWSMPPPRLQCWWLMDVVVANRTIFVVVKLLSEGTDNFLSALALPASCCRPKSHPSPNQKGFGCWHQRRVYWQSIGTKKPPLWTFWCAITAGYWWCIFCPPISLYYESVRGGGPFIEGSRGRQGGIGGECRARTRRGRSEESYRQPTTHKVMSMVKVMYLFLHVGNDGQRCSWDSKTPAQPQISLRTTVGLWKLLFFISQPIHWPRWWTKYQGR